MDAIEYNNHRNADLPKGFVFQTTDESLLQSLLLLKNNKQFATRNRFASTDEFATHPGVVTSDLVPGLLDDTRHYCYFYCEVPEEAEDTYGYAIICILGLLRWSERGQIDMDDNDADPEESQV
ncbi:hypothetical protein Tco_1367573 [Tanacetum coccineum]